MNTEHHDLNDVCHRLDRLIEHVATSGSRLETISRQIGRLQDLLTKSLAEQVSQTALLKSIDDKIQPPSDEDIGVDGGGIKLKEKEPKS